MKKMYLSAPLPFVGQKRMFAREFIKVLGQFPDSTVFVDLFGGSGLLSHITKCVRSDATVVYNDFDNSLLADGTEMRRLIRRAKERGVYLSMGYSERDAVTGTLYNSNMMIAPDGTAMNHRKLKPTGSEREKPFWAISFFTVGLRSTRATVTIFIYSALSSASAGR